LPVVGATGAGHNILYTAGCSGHGVGTQSMVGYLLAERIGGIEHPLCRRRCATRPHRRCPSRCSGAP
jgi:glycine/D-amino acid oxidase-like deaminating enzyme